MRVLVLGSDGQIGKPLCDYLRGCEVVEFDNYSNPVLDLRIPGILDKLMPSIDFVFFLAFDVGGATYLKAHQDSYEFISNNIKIMNNTFNSLERFGTPFIFASSQMSGMGHSTYGMLKRIGEQYTYSLGGKVLKFWNVYGKDRVKEKSHVITDFIEMARRGRIDMKTDGTERRQFLYVNDCCKCLQIIMDDYCVIPEIKLDVTSFKWNTIREVSEMISVECGCPVYPGIGKDDIQRNALIEPSKEILQYWEPETDLNAGILNIINGYL